MCNEIQERNLKIQEKGVPYMENYRNMMSSNKSSWQKYCKKSKTFYEEWDNLIQEELGLDF